MFLAATLVKRIGDSVSKRGWGGRSPRWWFLRGRGDKSCIRQHIEWLHGVADRAEAMSEVIPQRLANKSTCMTYVPVLYTPTASAAADAQ